MDVGMPAAPIAPSGTADVMVARSQPASIIGLPFAIPLEPKVECLAATKARAAGQAVVAMAEVVDLVDSSPSEVVADNDWVEVVPNVPPSHKAT